MKITRRSLRRRPGGTSPVAVRLLALVLAPVLAPAALAQDLPLPGFVDVASLDPDVPAPGAVIGHAVGADAVRYEAMVRYCEVLADASAHVTLTRHGQTHEGRALVHLTITGPRNRARLAEIRTDAGHLADPRGLSEEDATRVLDTLPGIAWLACSIHGDEVSPTDSALVLAYVLAAGTGKQITRLRDELVIHIDPLQNPDGRERYLAQISTLRGKVANPDVQAMHHAGLWSAGRGNHYLFDLNRDWLMQTQIETQGRAEAILAWHPHLLVDAHEMGANDTYLFEPPRRPLNRHMAESLMAWRRRMSADQAAAFDAYGWSYYTQEWYDEWYPGYTNAWGSLIGAIGVLYEQAGVSGDAVRQPAGNVLAYREAVHHNVVSFFANLETLRSNRRAVLEEYLADRRWAISGDGPDHESFLVPPDDDHSRLARFLAILRRHGIEYARTRAEITAEGVVDMWGQHSATRLFPAGTVVIRAAQPHRRLLHAALGFDPRMSDEFLLRERQDLEQGRGSRMYDVSAWSLPLAFAVETFAADRVPAFEAAPPRQDEPTRVAPEAAYGYLVPAYDSDVHRLLARLFARDCRPRAVREAFALRGRSYPAGTVLLRGHENPEDLARILAEAKQGLTVGVHAADTALSDTGPDLGGREFVLLHPPRVAIASQWPMSTTSFGASWWLLDAHVGLRSSPVNVQDLRGLDLRKYNVLVLPSSFNARAALDDGTIRRLRTWVESGGTLIALGGTAATLAAPDAGLSSVRLRRDVLADLAPYDETVARELTARSITVDPASVWARGSVAPRAAEAAGADAAGADDAGPGSGAAGRGEGSDDARRRADDWARRFGPRGVIVTGRADPRHWLAFGVDDRLPLLASGSSVLMSKPPAATPVRFGGEDALRLSGLLWPEARPRLARSAYATVERVGNGQVILFAGEPIYRGYWEGTGRLLLNAVLVGPGMGTSQPSPW